MSARTKKIEDMVRDIVLSIKEDYIEIYHIEYLREFGSYYLRVFIDKEGGVDINDCEHLSRALSEKLDEHEGDFSDDYILEVSSPGVDRALHTDAHYQAVIGEMIQLKTLVKIEGKKEHIGELVEVNEKQVTLKDDDDSYSIDRDKITKANVYITF